MGHFKKIILFLNKYIQRYFLVRNKNDKLLMKIDFRFVVKSIP